MTLSIDTAKRQLDRAEAVFAGIKAEYDAALASFTQERNASNAQRGTAEYLALRQKYNLASLEAQLETVTADVKDAQRELDAAQSLEASEQAQKQSQQNTAASAGDEVKQSGDAGVTNPPAPTAAFSPEGRVNSGSNADVAVTRGDPQGEDTGTSTEKLPLSNTQAVTNPPGTGAVKTLTTTPVTNPYGPGVGQAGDDGGSSKNETRQDIEFNFGDEIVAQDNILDKYASYTYQLSLFLLNEEDYRQVITSAKDPSAGINRAQLLIQSGGQLYDGEVVVGTNGKTGIAAERNRYFRLDYYIENCTVSNLLQGKATGTASAYTSLKMTVIEPNGISLIDNLKQAVSEYTGLKSFQSAIYCLVIRFRGYDENGNPVLAGNTNSGADTTDPYVISIKYIPFILTNVKFSVGSRATTYELHGSPVIYNFRLRHTIPSNVELTGETVNEILGGQIVTTSSATGARTNTTSQLGVERQPGRAPKGEPGGTTTSTSNSQVEAAPSVNAPAKASSSPKGTASPVRGLMQFLNETQNELVKKGTYTIADEFSVAFANPSIANAILKKPGDLSIDKTPMDASNDVRKQLDEVGQMVVSQRNFGVTAGMSIQQAIELIVRQSSYITSQQFKIYDEQTGVLKPNGTPIDNFAWFKVSWTAEPKGHDWKRNDYAYKYKFVISAYNSKSIDSAYFPRTRFRGVHKSYPYWFTGKNTSVLEYNQSYDNLYQVVLSGANDAIRENFTSNYTEIPRFVYQPVSGQSLQGADGLTNEPAANAADYLYSPTDFGKVKLKIVGDPAWIAQGEILQGNDPRLFNFKAFNPDGTINFDSQEILFEVVWNRPVDYDVNGDGLMNPNRQDPSGTATTGSQLVRSGRQSYVFYAISVTSEFRSGRFEQTLEGGLYIFPIPQRSQRLDPVVTSAQLGSQSFSSNQTPDQRTRVTPRKRKPANADQAFPLTNSRVATVPSTAISDQPSYTDYNAMGDFVNPAAIAQDMPAPVPPSTAATVRSGRGVFTPSKSTKTSKEY